MNPHVLFVDVTINCDIFSMIVSCIRGGCKTKASLVYFHHEITFIVLYFHVCTYNTDIYIYLFLFYSDSLIANYLTFMNYKIIFIILIMDTHGY